MATFFPGDLQPMNANQMKFNVYNDQECRQICDKMTKCAEGKRDVMRNLLRWKILNLILNEYLSLTHIKLCKVIQGRLEKTKIISHFPQSVLCNWFVSISYTLSTYCICSFKSGVFRFKKFTGGYTESRKNGHCTLLDRKGKRHKDHNMDQL